LAGPPRAVALVLLAVLGAPALAAPPGVDAEPRTEAERALVAALEQARRAPAPSQVDVLEKAAAALAGSREGGLLRVEAGLRLVDLGRAEAGLAALRHPDVARTTLGPVAGFGIARALESMGREREAAEAYRAAAVPGPDECPALFRAAELFARVGQQDAALEALDKAALDCPDRRPHALLESGRLLRAAQPREAALRFDLVDAEFPASAEAKQARAALAGLRRVAPEVTPAARYGRRLAQADALARAGKHRSAIAAYAALPLAGATPEQKEALRLRKARSLDAVGRDREAALQLKGIAAGSPHAAEAAWLLARLQRGDARVPAFERVVADFPGNPWAEEALLSLANHFTKDARDEEALPYWQRLLEAFPQGRYADRAAAKVGLAAFRAGRHEAAIQAMLPVARSRPDARSSAGLLYWSGRAHDAAGDEARARELWQQAALRFRRTYHGHKAVAALGGAVAAGPVMRSTEPPADLTPEQRARLRELLLLQRLEQARDELEASAPLGPEGQATLSVIERRLGNPRNSLVAMKRAWPQWISARAEDIPLEAWRLMFPLEFGETLQAEAAENGLDPALVAALICQESSFDPKAVSRAGARGLMQVMPATGRSLARQAGVRYRTAILHDPARSLDFGTRYLAAMIERFGGHVERALAAYNAGPHRVDKWTAGREDISAEDFIESIPFTETRQYVMTILASAEEYRRIHGLARSPVGQLASAPEPR
jgi:soluble lytic murein transglycosylase